MLGAVSTLNSHALEAVRKLTDYSIEESLSLIGLLSSIEVSPTEDGDVSFSPLPTPLTLSRDIHNLPLDNPREVATFLRNSSNGIQPRDDDELPKVVLLNRPAPHSLCLGTLLAPSTHFFTPVEQTLLSYTPFSPCYETSTVDGFAVVPRLRHPASLGGYHVSPIIDTPPTQFVEPPHQFVGSWFSTRHDLTQILRQKALSAPQLALSQQMDSYASMHPRVLDIVKNQHEVKNLIVNLCSLAVSDHVNPLGLPHRFDVIKISMELLEIFPSHLALLSDDLLSDDLLSDDVNNSTESLCHSLLDYYAEVDPSTGTRTLYIDASRHFYEQILPLSLRRYQTDSEPEASPHQPQFPPLPSTPPFPHPVQHDGMTLETPAQTSQTAQFQAQTTSALSMTDPMLPLFNIISSVLLHKSQNGLYFKLEQDDADRAISCLRFNRDYQAALRECCSYLERARMARKRSKHAMRNIDYCHIMEEAIRRVRAVAPPQFRSLDPDAHVLSPPFPFGYSVHPTIRTIFNIFFLPSIDTIANGLLCMLPQSCRMFVVDRFVSDGSPQPEGLMPYSPLLLLYCSMLRSVFLRYLSQPVICHTLIYLFIVFYKTMYSGMSLRRASRLMRAMPLFPANLFPNIPFHRILRHLIVLDRFITMLALLMVPHNEDCGTGLVSPPPIVDKLYAHLQAHSPSTIRHLAKPIELIMPEVLPRPPFPVHLSPPTSGSHSTTICVPPSGVLPNLVCVSYDSRQTPPFITTHCLSASYEYSDAASLLPPALGPGCIANSTAHSVIHRSNSFIYAFAQIHIFPFCTFPPHSLFERDVPCAFLDNIPPPPPDVYERRWVSTALSRLGMSSLNLPRLLADVLSVQFYSHVFYARQRTVSESPLFNIISQNPSVSSTIQKLVSFHVHLDLITHHGEAPPGPHRDLPDDLVLDHHSSCMFPESIFHPHVIQMHTTPRHPSLPNFIN